MKLKGTKTELAPAPAPEPEPEAKPALEAPNSGWKLVHQNDLPEISASQSEFEVPHGDGVTGVVPRERFARERDEVFGYGIQVNGVAHRKLRSGTGFGGI